MPDTAPPPASSIQRLRPRRGQGFQWDQTHPEAAPWADERAEAPPTAADRGRDVMGAEAEDASLNARLEQALARLDELDRRLAALEAAGQRSR